MEAAALARCLGAEVERVPVSSSKGQIGHTLAAAGAIEAAITAMAIARGVLPPTVGLEELDPGVPRSSHVLTAPRRRAVRAAISNSFGFGGTDTVLVFAEPERVPGARRTAAVARASWSPAAATVGPLGVLGARGDARATSSPGRAPRRGAARDPVRASTSTSARARRLDRAGRLATVAIAAALARRRASRSTRRRGARVGAIVGAAFGSVDGVDGVHAARLRQGREVREPGRLSRTSCPRRRSGTRRSTSACAGRCSPPRDLDATAESAVVTAVELLAAGEGDAIVAGSVEEASADGRALPRPGLLRRHRSRAAQRGRRRGRCSRRRSTRRGARRARARARRVVGVVARRRTPRRSPRRPAARRRRGRSSARDDARVDARARGLALGGRAAARASRARAGDHEGAGGFALRRRRWRALARGRAPTSALVLGVGAGSRATRSLLVRRRRAPHEARRGSARLALASRRSPLARAVAPARRAPRRVRAAATPLAPPTLGRVARGARAARGARGARRRAPRTLRIVARAARAVHRPRAPGARRGRRRAAATRSG